ncbi:MAG: TRAM domain-containing protein [Deltaproteobacteria bacterium]|nr:TRAM domain-containing protein [Deltaproteobacteria bacterium]
MRTLLVIFASASGYFIILPLGKRLALVGLVSGFLIAVAALIFEDRVKKTPLRIVAGGAIGLITGLVAANLLAYPLTLFFGNNSYLELAAYLFANSVVGYLGLTIGMKKGDEFDPSRLLVRLFKDVQAPAPGLAVAGRTALSPIVIDTSVIIDGRIAEVCDTGFIEGGIVVPQFVLQELQYIADSPDGVKRARGRRGLDILKQLQQNAKIEVSITERDFPAIKEVDAKLVALAKELRGKVLTNDGNLHRVAELQDVPVLNMNKLAAAMKPAAMPGEVMNIIVLKEGREHGQGVGYLEDGTMVVIDNAREFLGKAVNVSITSVLQTAGGRMIFSKLKDELKRPVYQQ